MKSGRKIYQELPGFNEHAAIHGLKNGSLRSLLTFMHTDPLPPDGTREAMILGLALVEAAERFRRGEGGKGKLRIL